jgi:hypothetical protein
MAKFGKEEFATQSIPQQVFSTIWELESEVNNGGYSQYFQNCSAETAPFVVAALNTIGASQAAGISMLAINAAFPGGLPAAPELISAAAGNFSDDILGQLAGLDKQFFTYPDNLTDLLFDFVSKYPDEFGVMPVPNDNQQAP